MEDTLVKNKITGSLTDKKSLIKQGIVRLLEIKDSDIRLLSLHQCRHAIDRAIHIGGAFSATKPMVSLYYGGILDLNIEQPTATDQDMFVLSKGHAVATLSSIYADLGYFDKSLLENSRSISSVVNGHPGPLLPGVHLATGPMGQGMGVAQGFAIAGQKSPAFDVFAMTGDGELQEGPIWEAVMYAGFKKLENLCVMVDHNGGQLDIVSHLHFPYHDLKRNFESFGWRVFHIDATKIHSIYDALLHFKLEKRDGRPTAIICNSTKGHGGFSTYMNTHKTSIPDDILGVEVSMQKQQRAVRVNEFCKFYNSLFAIGEYHDITAILYQHADSMGFDIGPQDQTISKVRSVPVSVKTKKASERNKKVSYEPEKLPNLETGKSYAAHEVIQSAMKEFARNDKIVSVDSDLASTSGLQAGVGFVDKERALNVGVAEANMMLIGEAFAILGNNVWISTFCPFWDWKILRRIAVGHQERLEVIEDGGWLSDGHGIDLTMVATAADLETKANGATHMGNDDALFYAEAAHVQIINVSCPRQLLSIMKWIMEGNKGIIYLRVLRSPSPVIYDENFQFEPGKAYRVTDNDDSVTTIVATGRGVHEAMKAADVLKKKDIGVSVIDMPSIDHQMILDLHASGKPVYIVDQNNGYLWKNFRDVLFDHVPQVNTKQMIPINTSIHGLHYIHSGTYEELSGHYKVDAEGITETIVKTLSDN